MAQRVNGNTDSGIESDEPECEGSVLLVVDIGESVITSRDNNDSNDCCSASGSHTDVANDGAQEVTSALAETGGHVMEEERRQSFQLRTAEEVVLTISCDTYSAYESQCLPEFFDGSAKGKSPQSYLEIRNHFVNHWQRVRPQRFGYHDLLRKVGHLHLGNVTAFSRVQKFLESHHVINANALKRNAIPVRRGDSSATAPKSRPPKQRKKSYSDNQMRKLGLTAQQATPGDDSRAAVSSSSSRTRPNPFKLVPLESYDDETQAPFALRLSIEALAIIDIHAHCVRTEVIGLLGGIFSPKTHELYILTAEPCASLDDHDLQCDMEPVSQALAKERLEQKSYHVVGWYHSHPTFVPNPSLRDLETQNNFQQLFSKESDGQPFVAVILSPYLSSERNALVSKFKCLWLSEQTNAQNDYKIPYELCPQIIRREKLVFQVCNKLQDLCQKIRGHASKVHMMRKVKRLRGLDINHLDKLCHSLRHYLCETGLSSVECDYMLRKCKEILIEELTDDCDDRHTTTTGET